MENKKEDSQMEENRVYLGLAVFLLLFTGIIIYSFNKPDFVTPTCLSDKEGLIEFEKGYLISNGNWDSKDELNFAIQKQNYIEMGCPI